MVKFNLFPSTANRGVAARTCRSDLVTGLSADGRRLASGGRDGVTRLWRQRQRAKWWK